MSRLIAVVLAVGVIAAPRLTATGHEWVREAQGPGAPERPQGERRIKWWLDEKSRLELGITNQQSADIEQIFQSTLPTLRQARKDLEELETRLSQIIKDGTAPVSAVTEQVDRVENARAEMNKLRTVMLYRIDRVLSAEQRARLKAWHERQGKDRPGDKPGPGRH